MTTQRNITLVGLPELEQKLDIDYLAQPEVEAARDTFLQRINRGGKGLGARRNTLTTEAKALSATVDSTLLYPRRTGTAWGRKNERIVAAMAPNVMRKAKERIEARWGAGSAGVA